MKFDVYTSYTVTISDNANSESTQSIKKRFSNLSADDAKSTVDDFFKSLPDNATDMYVEVMKSYNDQMDAALNSF